MKTQTQTHAHKEVPQGHTPNPAFATTTGYTASPAFVPPPGFIITHITPPPPPPQTLRSHTPTVNNTPTLPGLAPVHVPPGCFPLEVVQFLRSDRPNPRNPYPDADSHHWAFFIRTAPSSASVFARPRLPPVPGYGNYYELVGTPDTHTAQFFVGAKYAPETHHEWRGTHVIGWIHPGGGLAAFERTVRQVRVVRGQHGWRCQQWTYEVVSALVGGRCPGVYVDAGVTWAGLQRQMGYLLEAWERGDL